MIEMSRCLKVKEGCSIVERAGEGLIFHLFKGFRVGFLEDDYVGGTDTFLMGGVTEDVHEVELYDMLWGVQEEIVPGAVMQTVEP